MHVVVGTPGRVYDMLRRRALRADSIKMFVLVRCRFGCMGRFRLTSCCGAAGQAAPGTCRAGRHMLPTTASLLACGCPHCTASHRLPKPGLPGTALQDEADEMLSRGFKDQIYDIFQLLPPKIQVRGACWLWVAWG